jgi:hypothetical protein
MLSDGGENVPLNAPPIPEVGIEAEAKVSLHVEDPSFCNRLLLGLGRS